VSFDIILSSQVRRETRLSPQTRRRGCARWLRFARRANRTGAKGAGPAVVEGMSRVRARSDDEEEVDQEVTGVPHGAMSGGEGARRVPHHLAQLLQRLLHHLVYRRVEVFLASRCCPALKGKCAFGPFL
jgi:hypothetical protein